jgi:hypothetical protein
VAAAAILDTLRHLWCTIDQQKIPAAVVGGIALTTWKHPRATRDVDVMLSLTNDQLEQLLATLVDTGFRLKSEGTPVKLQHADIVQLEYEPPDAFVEVPVDLLVVKSDYARQALQRSVTVTSEALGFEIRVLACEDLIINKLSAGRVIDLADAAALIRANVNAMDLRYLASKVNQLGLTKSFTDIWADACPDKPSP